MTDPFEDALRRGTPLDFYRAKAEAYLDYPVTDAEREELERICAAPKITDEKFLDGLQHYIDASVAWDDMDEIVEELLGHGASRAELHARVNAVVARCKKRSR